VVVFGGEGSREGTLIYDPRRNEWRWPKPVREPAARSGGTMAYDAARKLHVLFGSQFTDDPHTWTYDVARNEWRDMQPESMPPTKENDAVLTFDPIHRVVLALVKLAAGQDDASVREVQTWAYDAGANRWSRMQPATEPDASGNRTRQLVFAPELNLAILENCTSKPREQQVWTYRYAAADGTVEPATTPSGPPTTLPLVEDAVVSVRALNRIEVGWTAPMDPMVAGYHVERAVVEVWSDDQLRRLKERTPPLDTPVVGGIRRIGPFQRLTSSPIRTASFVDDGIDLSAAQAVEGEPIYERNLGEDRIDRSGRPYPRSVFAYRVRAVDGQGSEGGPSSAFLTIPSAPQHVFSREDSGTCHIRWSGNPEQGIAGYRVYRMDGRWDKDTVSRLTPDPVVANEYADTSAGNRSRRYYVVAVDAFGQEGLPSSPVWHQREWRTFYAPFVGPWHQ
jgi:hypothetical protein